jgi:membrane protein involved in colicin uptake
MGLMDKVKAQAQNVAAQAKSAAGQAQDKMEQMQLRKKADEAAKQLGYLIHKERTGGAAAGAEADKLVSEISALERQMAEEEAGQAAAGEAAQSPPPTSSSDATPGDFKL